MGVEARPIVTGIDVLGFYLETLGDRRLGRFHGRGWAVLLLRGSHVGLFICLSNTWAHSGKRLHDVKHTPVSGKGKSAIGCPPGIGVFQGVEGDVQG
jgi:hypothetical protein